MTKDEAIAIIQDYIDLDSDTHNEFLDALRVLANPWIPCSERLPEENGNYLVTAIWNGKREVDMDYFQFLCQWDDYKDTVIAWMPLPEPYEGTCHTFGYTSPTNG